MRQIAKELWASLLRGARLVFFQPVDLDAPALHPVTLVVLIVMSIAMTVSFEAATAGDWLTFDGLSVPIARWGLFWAMLAVLGLAPGYVPFSRILADLAAIQPFVFLLMAFVVIDASKGRVNATQPQQS